MADLGRCRLLTKEIAKNELMNSTTYFLSDCDGKYNERVLYLFVMDVIYKVCLQYVTGVLGRSPFLQRSPGFVHSFEAMFLARFLSCRRSVGSKQSYPWLV